ncbi:unnamed protein product [Cuscuta campestris]|uniref:Protein kinase domain-containing protein n=1 Tax=Cuscuta campestris TaxID=132261 RepID=A0A484M7V2_9ASTE|nr:unnamed protein product [Cuscuta campestris]
MFPSTLTQLALHQNQFSGSLPITTEASPSNLQVLILSLDRLSGEIPSSTANASMLTLVELNKNSFTGLIPNLGLLRSLRTLRLWENNLKGALSPTQHLTFLTSLTNCPNLEHLEIRDNPLNAILPPSVGNLSSSLQSFMFSDCNINGPIPPGFGNLKSLQFLELAENQLTGLHPNNTKKILNIAIDVALALEYLHHNHTFAVLHCDLKPSNVLLAENMIAHVGDFGISTLFDEGEAMTQTKTFATVGYAAPDLKGKYPHAEMCTVMG